MPDFEELLREFGDFLWSVARRWANIIGCAAFAFAAIWYPKLTVSTKHPSGKEFPVSSWWILGACLAIALFQAWRDEHRKAQSKRRQEILTRITDEFHRAKGYGQPQVDWLGLLIENSADFSNQRDFDWVCAKLAKEHSDPFGYFNVKYTRRSFGRRKRFKFIVDARTAHYGGHKIFSDRDAQNYMKGFWADENKLVTTKERTLKAMFLGH